MFVFLFLPLTFTPVALPWGAPAVVVLNPSAGRAVAGGLELTAFGPDVDAMEGGYP